MSNQELFRAKAQEICNHCTIKGLPQPFYLIKEQNYLINFTWQYEGKKHVLALYYKPTRQSWTLTAYNDLWLQTVIIPVLEPLCSSSARSPVPEAASSSLEASFSSANRTQAYFEGALACLTLLNPFATDNVDCSIICQLTRKAVEYILLDPACSYLDQAALAAVVDVPVSTQFFTAKEYLNQCLTLCHINDAAK